MHVIRKGALTECALEVLPGSENSDPGKTSTEVNTEAESFQQMIISTIQSFGQVDGSTICNNQLNIYLIGVDDGKSECFSVMASIMQFFVTAVDVDASRYWLRALINIATAEKEMVMKVDVDQMFDLQPEQANILDTFEDSIRRYAHSLLVGVESNQEHIDPSLIPLIPMIRYANADLNNFTNSWKAGEIDQREKLASYTQSIQILREVEQHKQHKLQNASSNPVLVQRTRIHWLDAPYYVALSYREFATKNADSLPTSSAVDCSVEINNNFFTASVIFLFPLGKDGFRFINVYTDQSII
ncbi:Integrator complex subunit 7 [Gigaspora margarita]|uniref:Integrator complex subunit 7 n=1 Tax=Gigaspora margarita TaxID=4874 RepID=A0A8H3XIC2_GIGMA|nr:Integrator complex subunit 7 [Gigaspora margarita]